MTHGNSQRQLLPPPFAGSWHWSRILYDNVIQVYNSRMAVTLRRREQCFRCRASEADAATICSMSVLLIDAKHIVPIGIHSPHCRPDLMSAINRLSDTSVMPARSSYSLRIISHRSKSIHSIGPMPHCPASSQLSCIRIDSTARFKASGWAATICRMCCFFLT